MSTIGMVLSGILGIISIVLIIIILMQSDRSAGLGAIGGEDTYWSKNKANSMEGALEKYTKVLGALFLIIALAINFLA